MTYADLRRVDGRSVRQAVAAGQWTGPTPGLAPGFVQANLVVLPRDLAFDFLLFCQRNPKPCPLLDVTETGDPEPKLAAPGADVRNQVPRYAVYEHGVRVATPTDLHPWWRPDAVAFLLGCSFTFENALMRAGVPVRHIEQSRNVPMYRTNLACRPAGVFRGNQVVSMRPIRPELIATVCTICRCFPKAHGTPIHWGDPCAIGIADLNAPDFGDAVDIAPGEIPVFWACGVTPQEAIMTIRPPLALTHLPGHMFVTDLREEHAAE